MGICIHYKGKLKDLGLLDEVCRELMTIGDVMGWEYQHLDEDVTQPSTAKLEHGPDGAVIKGELALKGVILRIHPEVSVDFLFDGEGKIRDLLEAALGDEAAPLDGWTQVKTQFGSPDVHITIIKLMRHLSSKFFAEFEVNDEGDYWETGDAVLLSKKFRFLDNAISLLEDALSKIPAEGLGNDPEVLADKIEEVFKNLRLPGEDTWGSALL